MKMKVIAALIALALTAITVYILPLIAYWLLHWFAALSPQQQFWVNISQAVLGFAVAGVVLWRWLKKRRAV